MDTTLKNVVADLDTHGYWRGRLSLEPFRRVCEGLGSIVATHKVQIRRDLPRSSYLSRPHAVPLHTDHPEIELVAWWCEIADASNGAILLCDGFEVLHRFELSGHNTSVLSSINVRYRLLPELKLHALWRMLTRKKDAVQLYYAPWLVDRNLSEYANECLLHFESTLAGCMVAGVQMSPSDCLIAHNSRMLHGREALDENSKRSLLRFWIKSSFGSAGLAPLPSREGPYGN
jgi:hypothetical protein